MKVFSIFAYQDFTMTEQRYPFVLIPYIFTMPLFYPRGKIFEVLVTILPHMIISEYFIKCYITNFSCRYMNKYICSAS